MDDLDEKALDDVGPIDFLVIEFPESHLAGEGLAELLNLVDRRIIRILDLVFVAKEADDTVVRLHIEEHDDDAVLAPFTGASSGLLNDFDLTTVGQILTPGTWAAVLVYENSWAGPLAGALRHAGGQLVAGGRLPVQAILAALDAAEATAGADLRLVEGA